MWIFPAVLLLLLLLSDTCRSSCETSSPHFVFVQTCPDPSPATEPWPPSCWGSLGAPLQELGILSLSHEDQELPCSSSEISWMCPSTPHSLLQPLAPSLALQSCHWSLSHQENWEFFTLDMEFLGLPHPLDAASPAGTAPTGAGAGLGSIWGNLKHFLPGKESSGASCEVSGVWLHLWLQLGVSWKWRRAEGSQPWEKSHLPLGFLLHGRIPCCLWPLCPFPTRSWNSLWKNNFGD